MTTNHTTKTDESIHDTQSLDGTETTLASLTVPTDELWYVDGVYVATDGSGDAAGVELAVAIGDSTTLDGMEPTIDRAGRAASVGFDTTRTDGGVAEVDSYASEGEEVRLVETYEDGSTGEYNYSLQIRGVL